MDFPSPLVAVSSAWDAFRTSWGASVQGYRMHVAESTL
jgi:hypothetical protein